MVDLLNYVMIILFILFFLSAVLYSDALIVKVLDTDNQPIYNANVEILNYDSLGYSTDEDGLFIINNKRDDFLTMKVSHIGFETKIINIDMSYKEDIVIILSDNMLDYDDVVITGSRLETYVKDVPVLTHVISMEDINTSAYNSVKEVLEMTLPNVQNAMSTHAGTSDNRVKIQGLDNKYVLFMIDGVRVSGEFAGNLDFSMLSLSDVEKIEVIEGGMSSLYGSSAVGGVVNIITKKNKQPFAFSFSVLNDSPNVISKNLNIGLNYKNIRYNIDGVLQNSSGYDLTMYDEVYDDLQGGSFINTLEKYKTSSISHALEYNFKQKYYLRFNSKEYYKDIYLYNEYSSFIDFEPFIDYYKSYRHEMPKAQDDRYGLLFEVSGMNSKFKISYNQEEYVKSNYYFNYTAINNNPTIWNFYNVSEELESHEFVNAIHRNKALNIQYNRQVLNHSIILGFEQTDDSYNSFNIYKYTGDKGPGDNYIGIPTQSNPTGEYIYELNTCDYPLDYEKSDCEYSSIFGSIDGIEYFKRKALYIGDQINLKNDDKLSFSFRNIFSSNYKDNMVYSFAYMVRKFQPYDLRFNYTRGFRIPAIKELYYNFLGHSPPILGNDNLVPTTNNYFALSLDKRVYNNSFSIEVFYNDVENMVAVNSVDYLSAFSETALQYNNFESVIMRGLNCHYDRKLNNKNQLKFVYNYTNPFSNNIEALELISKHSMKINYLYDIIINKLKFSLNIKYSDKKFAYSNNEKIWLEDFMIVDTMFIASIKDFMVVKFGCKNIFDYIDSRRLYSEYLASYDPGKRYTVQISFNY
tara:strand:- start:835 stop:3246 length:2412 start_codon:yes stop_codon:yes gene_type:complete